MQWTRLPFRNTGTLGLIIFAVIATNIHWHWTPNSYIPAGWCAASLGISWFMQWLMAQNFPCYSQAIRT
jgi:hypothetical protein